MKKFLSFLFFIFYVVIFGQNKWEIRFYTIIENQEFKIYADNDEFMPMSAKFNFKTKNLSNTLSDNEIVVIPPRTKKLHIATLTPIDPYSKNEVEYTNTYNFGNALQENFKEEYIYSLPFETGKTHLIFQGYNGKFSHQNENSLDFNLKIGDKILSAREGTVVEVVNSHNQNCANISCAKYNNKVVILHSDGTFADYSHLKYKGTTVKKGDVVKKGQLLGFSGNTGFSSGPHLHFAVFINRIDGKRTTLKTLFKTSAEDGVFLEEGKNYTKNYRE